MASQQPALPQEQPEQVVAEQAVQRVPDQGGDPEIANQPEQLVPAEQIVVADQTCKPEDTSMEARVVGDLLKRIKTDQELSNKMENLHIENRTIKRRSRIRETRSNFMTDPIASKNSPLTDLRAKCRNYEKQKEEEEAVCSNSSSTETNKPIVRAAQLDLKQSNDVKLLLDKTRSLSLTRKSDDEEKTFGEGSLSKDFKECVTVTDKTEDKYNAPSFRRPRTNSAPSIAKRTNDGTSTMPNPQQQPNSCSAQARLPLASDGTTEYELCCYFDEYVHIPKKMSFMAEQMYV
ncbi:uncharacterized protein LOC106648828 [Trichogramma pretiosum]|uniref:uncharacterized protein LOC106648828 n=1 Tax=Trichogramma pretiosum TaxID=7493 RepID=UPI0006C98735|nr:uncharacterized protein LOC106648828 [Trichogramma pretiosum]